MRAKPPSKGTASRLRISPNYPVERKALATMSSHLPFPTGGAEDRCSDKLSDYFRIILRTFWLQTERRSRLLKLSAKRVACKSSLASWQSEGILKPQKCPNPMP